MAGWADASNPEGRLQRHAVVWIAGKIQRLLEPPGTKYSAAHAINEQGLVVGWVSNSQDLGKQWGAGNACVWECGRCTEIRISGTMGSKALAINNRGEVVGTAFLEEPREQRAFLWTRELGVVSLRCWWHHLVRFELSTANDINDRGQIVGAAFADGPWPGVYKPSYGFLLTPVP
jgi:probable HAF family extracellular repeat protein